MPVHIQYSKAFFTTKIFCYFHNLRNKVFNILVDSHKNTKRSQLIAFTILCSGIFEGLKKLHYFFAL